MPPSLPTPASGYIPHLLDLHVRGPAHSRFAPPGAVVNLPVGSRPGLLPLPTSNLPSSSLVSGVMQPVAGVHHMTHLLSVPPPQNVTTQLPPLPPSFPDMSLITSVPPPPLGHLNVSDVAPLNPKEPLLPLPPPVSTSFSAGVSQDFVSQSEYYSRYSDQTYLLAESGVSFPAPSAGNICFGVGSTGPGISEAADTQFGQFREAKPVQMTKTARDREARAKKKQRKQQAMEPVSVESFLGLSVTEPGAAADNLDKDNEAAQADLEVKPETESVILEQKEDIRTEEVPAKVEDDAPTSVVVPVIDETALPGVETDDAAVETKEYHFVWDAMDDEQMSDISVSSVHTSDLSSFDDEGEQPATPVGAESENPVSDASPVKDSQPEKSCNESGRYSLFLLYSYLSCYPIPLVVVDLLVIIVNICKKNCQFTTVCKDDVMISVL